MGCGCTKLNSHKKKHNDRPDIIEFDNNHMKNPQYKEKSNKKIKKFQGQGVAIGGSHQNEFNGVGNKVDENQRQKILEAAEKRIQVIQNRGVKKENVFEFELQKKKLEEAKKYENEQYVLKWK